MNSFQKGFQKNPSFPNAPGFPMHAGGQPKKDPLKNIKPLLPKLTNGTIQPNEFKEITKDANNLSNPELEKAFEAFKNQNDFLEKFENLVHGDIGANGFFMLLKLLNDSYQKKILTLIYSKNFISNITLF